MKRYIAVIELDDDEEIVGDANISYTYRSNGTNYGTDESVELKEESEDAKNKTYEDGLNEAWEVARKITCAPTSGGQDEEWVNDMFGYQSRSAVMRNYSASEAITKIKEYEEKQKKAEIHVGDEIYSELTNSKAVVQHIDAWDRYQCFLDSGSQFIIDKHTFNEYWVKTGKSYPQIAKVLKQMKEGEGR